jgi:hypothetical protein
MIRVFLVACVYAQIFYGQVLHGEHQEQSQILKHCLGNNVPTFSWTAYKTTDKVAVSGWFNDVKLEYGVKDQEVKFVPLKEILEGASFLIKSHSVASGNPERDATLVKSFFKLFSDDTISGKVVKVDDDFFTVDIQMNGEKRPIIFNYKIDSSNMLTASSNIDMLEFALKKPYESISSACKSLHTGADGVAKTWSTVSLDIKVPVVSECH